MNTKDFDGLIRSVKEAGQILRGEVKPAREFQVRVSEGPSKRKGFALCIKSGEPQLLVPSKVYRAVYSSGDLVGVTDEAGDAAIYPSDCFIKLEFPTEIEHVLVELQKAA